MSEKTYTIEELEVENGVLLTGDISPKKKVTKKAFAELLETETYTGVNHTDRVQFLKDNGYPVTRKNMVDASLSTKPIE